MEGIRRGDGAEMVGSGKLGATGSRPDVERRNELGRREREKTSVKIESEKGELNRN